MQSVMGPLPGIGRHGLPESVVAVVWAGHIGELLPLLRKLASEQAAIVLWYLDADDVTAALHGALAGTSFVAQPLLDREDLRAGVVHLVRGRCRSWFEGHSLRVEALGKGDSPSIERFLVSLAACWGRRSMAVTSPLSAAEASRGLESVRAAGGIGLSSALLGWASSLRGDGSVRSEARTTRAKRIGGELGHQPSSTERATPSTPGRRLFAIPRASLQAARAAAQIALREARERGRLRVWLPQCRTGSLVYATGMLLSEFAADSDLPAKIQIFGTDQDEEALAIARTGRYPAQAALDMNLAWRARYTFDDGDTIRVSAALREICVFSRHRLGWDPPLSRIDLVVCHGMGERLDAARMPAVIDALHFSLRQNGLLLALDTAELFPPHRFERAPEGYLRARPRRPKRITEPRARRAESRALISTREPLPRNQPFGSSLEHEGAQPESSEADERALADAIRQRIDLVGLVHAIPVPVLFCDEELRILELSTAACQAFGLSDAHRGSALGDLFERIPGGADITLAAGRALANSSTQDLTIRTGQQTYLVRISATQRMLRPGVTVAFTDVSDLDAAQRRATAQRHQQAAVARVGDIALSATHEAELFEEALGVLFGNISVCVSGVILEKTGDDHELAILASRGLGDDPWSLLHEMGEPAQLLEAVLEHERPVMHAELNSMLVRARAPSSESPGSKPRSAPFHSALPFVSDGIACPILNEGKLLGIIALYAKQRGLEAAEHQHFVQAIANVLGGAIARHRTRRRLALELEVSSVLASALDAATAGSGLARALSVALEATEVELWCPNLAAAQPWARLYPGPDEAPESPASLLAFISNDGPDAEGLWCTSGSEGVREILLPVRRGDQLAAVLRMQGRSLRSPADELCDGLRRIGFMLGDFLDRLQVQEALKRSEASYRQTSAKFEALYASLPVGVSIHDPDGSIRRMNSYLTALASSDDDRIAGAVAQLYGVEAPPWIAGVLATGEPLRDIELTTTQGNAAQSWLCNFAPIRDLDGTVLGASAVVQDITALKRIEASLREADRQKDDFLAMLGHELRNPIAAIRNATELLSRANPSAEQLLRLESIFNRQTLQMTKLIDGLLDVARVAHGKVELQITPVNVTDLVRQVVDDRRHQFGTRTVDVRLPDGEVWVQADRVRFVQVLDNLLSNALKFTAQSGNVVVEVESSARGGRVRVKDDGIGIEAELLPQIFEPFRQGRAASLRARDGLGLGLALVKGLLDLHGFVLDVHSPGAGQGASFVFDFPVTTAPEETPPESQFSMRPLSLLLVEDNADIADTLAELLADSGHDVQVARSAEDALVALRGRTPDIVLCDIGLPGMDGLALAAQLRDDAALQSLKLVAMTGYGDVSTRARIESAGFDRYLVKPVKLDALQHCLMRLAATKRPELNRR